MSNSTVALYTIALLAAMVRRKSDREFGAWVNSARGRIQCPFAQRLGQRPGPELVGEVDREARIHHRFDLRVLGREGVERRMRDAEGAAGDVGDERRRGFHAADIGHLADEITGADQGDPADWLSPERTRQAASRRFMTTVTAIGCAGLPHTYILL
jgi:hypothetical protein